MNVIKFKPREAVSHMAKNARKKMENVSQSLSGFLTHIAYQLRFQKLFRTAFNSGQTVGIERDAREAVRSEFESGAYTTDAYFSPLTSSPELQLARSIARYGFFNFLNSNRSSSDLYPLVNSLLPLDVQKTAATLLTANAYRPKYKRWKKRAFLQGLLGGLLPVLNPVLQIADGVLQLPGTNLLATLKSLGGKDILTDPSWGITTVKTESFNGDLAWSTNISIGTPSRSFRLNIDSGSADLFLFGPNCSTCSLSNHTDYDPTRSTSSSRFFEAQDFAQTFGDGSSVNGSLVADTVNFGNSIKVSNQTFGLANTVSPDWAALPVDGLMGIGPDSLSILGTNSIGVFSQLVASNTLFSPVIGIALVKASAQRAGSSAGQYTFGDVSDKWIAGGRRAITWKNVTSQHFWGVALTGIYVNGTNVMPSDDPPRAIIDTGTSLTIVSEAAAAAIHEKIPGALIDPDNGVWQVPCSIKSADSSVPKTSKPSSTQVSLLSLLKRSSNRRSLPNLGLHRLVPEEKIQTRSMSTKKVTSPNVFFEFGVGSSQFAIPAEDLAYQSIDDNRISTDGNHMCYSGIQAGSEAFVVLGDTFIKNQYVALRYDSNGQKSVGLGRRSDLPTFT
ncbi:hypothetical protein CROQUDRAFT_85888 [Cronartium quercuum f. sp. fusiforme G11]|uniref:Peptidase A1 domain-containing protein n=1 Tax=Cronartium quercuum f. sp. fusiforme G11 TaxID=708437 RepID=A0A9P6NV40_9BASI|nr:hypothetical protein CROQUDRAFT_85888 [Cronartium quercuum f. sp. fusiforme G11]